MSTPDSSYVNTHGWRVTADTGRFFSGKPSPDMMRLSDEIDQKGLELRDLLTKVTESWPTRMDNGRPFILVDEYHEWVSTYAPSLFNLGRDLLAREHYYGCQALINDGRLCGVGQNDKQDYTHGLHFCHKHQDRPIGYVKEKLHETQLSGGLTLGWSQVEAIARNSLETLQKCWPDLFQELINKYVDEEITSRLYEKWSVA